MGPGDVFHFTIYINEFDLAGDILAPNDAGDSLLGHDVPLVFLPLRRLPAGKSSLATGGAEAVGNGREPATRLG